MDAPIYEGYPNRNFGAYVYDRVGYYDDTYQTARTVMRPDALLSSAEWQSLDTDDITGLSLFIKDGSGKANTNVSVYALSENSTWTESSITWNNVGAYFRIAYATAALGGKNWTEFDLTDLAKAWKNGVLDEDAGFLLKMVTESGYRTIYSCESGTADYRPYMVLTYEAEAYLNYSVKDLDEGDSFTLTAGARLGISGSVTWESDNEAIASVTQSGVVTGHLAGSTTITASFTDKSGNDLSASCTVYVTVADGLYYIKNAASGLCMQAASGSNRMFAQNTNTASRHTQLWKITHISNGNYVVRSLPDFSKALTISAAGQVTIGNAAVSDTDVTSGFLWQITHNSFGYAFKQGGLDANTMTPAASISNSLVYPRAWTSTLNSHWELEEAVGIFFRDDDTHQIVTSANVKYIGVGDKVSYTSLALSLEYYGINYSSSWTSSNTAIATVDLSGTITALSTGQTIISHQAAVNGIIYSTAVTVRVNIMPAGLYYIRNWGMDGHITCPELANGAAVYHSEFSLSELPQWVFTHVGDDTYTIHYNNSSTKYYLGVSGDSSSEGQAIVLRTGTITSGMKWRIEVTASGAYKLTALSSIDNNLSMRVSPEEIDIDNPNRRTIIQSLYTEDANYSGEEQSDVDSTEGCYPQYNDEWLLCPVRNNTADGTSGNPYTYIFEPQYKNLWCWLACARIASSRFMDNPISLKSAAMRLVKGTSDLSQFKQLEPASANDFDERNRGGDGANIVNAIGYFLGSGNGTACSYDKRIYDEETLRSLLAYTPVIVCHRIYENNEPSSIGHYTIIYDCYYDTSAGIWRYRIYNPLPEDQGTYLEGSYQWICNHKDNIIGVDPEGEAGIWDGVVVFCQGDYQNTIEWLGAT